MAICDNNTEQEQRIKHDTNNQRNCTRVQKTTRNGRIGG